MTDHTLPVSGSRHKHPAWTRWLDVVLRTAHVGAMGALFGGAVGGLSDPGLLSWRHLVVGTGSALIASEIYHSRHWFYQGRGALVLLHAGLFGLVPLCPAWRVPALAAALALGMVGSHMPKSLRHWSFLHGRVVSPD